MNEQNNKQQYMRKSYYAYIELKPPPRIELGVFRLQIGCTNHYAKGANV